MVSKSVRITPSKSFKKNGSKPIKDLFQGRRRTPQKCSFHTSSSLITSINKSILICHRRFIKLFTKFTKISNSPKKKHGFHLLRSNVVEPLSFPPSPDPPNILPPLSFLRCKTVFLDLDETLVHSKTDPQPERFDFVVHPMIDGETVNFYVLKRPGVDELLEVLSKHFEVIVFTAGIKEYASLVLDELDRKGLISHRLYRDSCKQMDGGKFVKDLSGMGRDLKSLVIVDDNPNAYISQPENALPIVPFVDDPADRELQKVISFCHFSAFFDDMREAVAHFVPSSTGLLNFF